MQKRVVFVVLMSVLLLVGMIGAVVAAEQSNDKSTGFLNKIARGINNFFNSFLGLFGRNVQFSPTPICTDYGEEGCCGNGQIEYDETNGWEQCDSDNLNEETCWSRGYAGGTLSCSSECIFDESGCTDYVCGNDIVEGNEMCDATDLNGNDCESLGYAGGTLSCNDNCAFNVSKCTTQCGNEQVDWGEQCDGSNLNEKSCSSDGIGYTSGTLSCTDCRFNTSQCTKRCGDGKKNVNEQCDGSDLDGKTCQSLGSATGILSCKSDCTFDKSNCKACSLGDVMEPGCNDPENPNEFGPCTGAITCDANGKWISTCDCPECYSGDTQACGDGAIGGEWKCVSGKWIDTCEYPQGLCDNGESSQTMDCSDRISSDCTGTATCSQGTWDESKCKCASYGCMDSTACNYDSNATKQEEGMCEYECLSFGVSGPQLSITGISGDTGNLKCNTSIESPMNQSGIPLGHTTESIKVKFRLYEGEKMVKEEGKDSTITRGGIVYLEQSFDGFLKKYDMNGSLVCQVEIFNGTGGLRISGDGGPFGSNEIADLDRDGIASFTDPYNPSSISDCDDWPFDDLSESEVSCPDDPNHPNEILDDETGEYNLIDCLEDDDNDGIGDYARCAYCRTPGRQDVADDIDNNCQGKSQGFIDINPYNYGRKESCIVSDYNGDGKNNETVLSEFESLAGGKDSFCQMVDEIDEVMGCGSYPANDIIPPRQIKYGWYVQSTSTGETVKCSQLDQGLQSYCGCDLSPESIDTEKNMCKKNNYNLYIYKPAGVRDEGGDSKIGKVGFHIKSDGSVDYSDSETNLYVFVSDASNTNSYAGLYEVTVFTKKIGDKILGMATSFVPKDVFYTEKEINGETRGTSKKELSYPKQYIDSFRGELDYKAFSAKYADAVKKFKWKDTCVAKDKCADGGSSSIQQNLLKTEPYGYFLRDSDKLKIYVSDGLNGEKLLQATTSFPIRLTDVDDPSCKYDHPSNDVSTAPKHQWPEDYLMRPYSDGENAVALTGTPYCYDQDGDGFCGIPLHWENAGTFNGNQIAGINGYYTGANLIPSLANQKMTDCIKSRNDCVFYPASQNYDYAYDRYFTAYNISVKNEANKYVSSKQFPDCDDSLDVNKYYVWDPTTMRPIPIKESYVSGDENKQITAWDVHPFTSLTRSANCLLQYFDFNCNKGGNAGWDYGSLQYGMTPFDSNLHTGVEAFKTTEKSGNVLDSLDARCALPNVKALYEQETGKFWTPVSIAMGALTVGSFFFPPLALPVVVLDSSLGVIQLSEARLISTSGVNELKPIGDERAFWGAVSVAGSVLAVPNAMKTVSNMEDAQKVLKIRQTSKGAIAEVAEAPTASASTAAKVAKVDEALANSRVKSILSGDIALDDATLLEKSLDSGDVVVAGLWKQAGKDKGVVSATRQIIAKSAGDEKILIDDAKFIKGMAEDSLAKLSNEEFGGVVSEVAKSRSITNLKEVDIAGQRFIEVLPSNDNGIGRFVAEHPNVRLVVDPSIRKRVNGKEVIDSTFSGYWKPSGGTQGIIAINYENLFITNEKLQKSILEASLLRHELRHRLYTQRFLSGKISSLQDFIIRPEGVSPGPSRTYGRFLEVDELVTHLEGRATTMLDEKTKEMETILKKVLKKEKLTADEVDSIKAYIDGNYAFGGYSTIVKDLLQQTDNAQARIMATFDKFSSKLIISKGIDADNRDGIYLLTVYNADTNIYFKIREASERIMGSKRNYLRMEVELNDGTIYMSKIYRDDFDKYFTAIFSKQPLSAKLTYDDVQPLVSAFYQNIEQTRKIADKLNNDPINNIYKIHARYTNLNHQIGDLVYETGFGKEQLSQLEIYNIGREVKALRKSIAELTKDVRELAKPRNVPILQIPGGTK